MNKNNFFLAFLIFVFIAFGVALNTYEKNSIDRSKLPEKLEENSLFQRWITNIKNKDLEQIKADDFFFVEENEIYNTKWMRVYSAEDEDVQREYHERLQAHKDIDHVVFSPSERLYLDFRNVKRDGYEANEANFYGQLDNKIIDARIVDCSVRANCYFDRAYFLENEVFVISEVSRTIDKKDDTVAECSKSEVCEYSFKIHLVDLKHNQRIIYESIAFDAILDDLVPKL